MSLTEVQAVDGRCISSPQQFRTEIVEKCEPVILRGLVRDWPIINTAKSHNALATYLHAQAAPHPIGVFVAPAAIGGRYYYTDDLSGFNFRQETMAFPDALARVMAERNDDAETAYLGSVPIADYLPSLIDDLPMELLGARVSPRLWLGHAAHIATHYDTMDNLACVFLGTRRFTLYPPDAVADLYVGPIDFTMAGQPVSLAAEAGGDPARYPRFEAVRDRALVADLEPGDALYLPKLWWHQVVSTQPLNGLINYWWDAFALGPDSPNMSLMFALINIAERPLPERMAWRAFFDHYVFRPDGHPLAHLPPDKHGILGPLKPDNFGRIRARIMQALRGQH
jgi:hypothetical protein